MYKKLRSVLALIHQCLFYSTILLVVTCLLPDSNAQIRSLLLLLPVIVSWFFMPRLKRFWQLVLLHLVFLLFPLIWCRSLAEIIISEVFLVSLSLIHFLESRLQDGQRPISIPSILTLVLYPFIVGFHEQTHAGSLLTLFLIVMCIELLIFILYKFLNNMSNFVDLHSGNAEMPLRQMERVDHGMILIFLVTLVAFIILMWGTGLYRYLAIIPETIIWLISSFLSLFTLGLTEPESESKPDSAFPMPAPQSEPSEFLYLLGELIGGIVLFVVAVIVIVAIYRLLSSRLNTRAENKDRKEFLMPFQEETSLRRQKREDALSWRDFSPSGQIRRIYIKTILKSKKKKQTLSVSHTPSELEQSVELPEGQESDTLHALYEKARYSKDGCSKEEWMNYRRSGM